MSRLGTRADHPATEAVQAIDTGLNDLFAANLWSLSAGELGRLLISLEQVTRRVDAARVALTAQAECALVAEHEGATSLAAFLRATADLPASTTRARLRLHTALGSRPIVAEAFTAGQIGMESAAAICAAIDGLPAAVPAALTGQIEQLLVEVAKDEGTKAVVQRAAQIVHRFAPDELARREAIEAQRNRFALRLRHDGGISFAGALGVEAAAEVLPVLNAFAAPLPATDGTPDFRDTEQRYADAFIQVCRLAGAVGPNVRGERPHVAVTVSLDALEGRLGSAPGLLDTGAALSAEAVRRLACDATIIPVVLGSAGEPLDIGRASRMWPQAMRRAIEVRDRGCTMPGCERPQTWCDIHHRKHWADGGSTCLENGVLLCERHHTIVHRDRWIIEMVDGLPWFIPPPWVDPSRTRRLHSRFKTRALDP